MASQAREKGVENSILRNVAITIGLIILLIVFAAYLYNVETGDMQEAVMKAVSLVIHTNTTPSVNSSWFFIISIIGGILSIYIIFTIISLFYGGVLRKNMQEGNKMKKIKTMKDHIIICGGGRVGESVAEELKKAKKPFLIIEKDSSRAKDLEEKYLVMADNALEKSVLKQASIEKAKTILCCLDSDGNNLLLAVTAKDMNSRIEVIAKVDDASIVDKLRAMGINKVILPAVIGGKRIAEEVLKSTSPPPMVSVAKKPGMP